MHQYTSRRLQLQQWSDVPCNKPHGFVCALRPRVSLNQKLRDDFTTSAPLDFTTTQSASILPFLPLLPTTRTGALGITAPEKATIPITTTRGIAAALGSSQLSSSTPQAQVQESDFRRLSLPPVKRYASDLWTQFDSVLPSARRNKVARPRPQTRRPSSAKKQTSVISSDFPRNRKFLRSPKLKQQRRRPRKRVWDLLRQIYIYQ